MNKLIKVILIFILGLGCGYWWRMTQVEEGFKKRIELIETQRREMYRDWLELEIRVTILEKRLGVRR